MHRLLLESRLLGQVTALFDVAARTADGVLCESSWVLLATIILGKAQIKLFWRGASKSQFKGWPNHTQATKIGDYSGAQAAHITARLVKVPGVLSIFRITTSESYSFRKPEHQVQTGVQTAWEFEKTWKDLRFRQCEENRELVWRLDRKLTKACSLLYRKHRGAVCLASLAWS